MKLICQEKTCKACGNKHTDPVNKTKRLNLYSELCKPCRRKLRTELYLSNPSNRTKHDVAMHNYYLKNKSKYKCKSGQRRGFKSDRYINAEFKGAELHHIDNRYLVYIPSWLHTELRHKQTSPQSMRLINDWANRWVEYEKTHAEKTTQERLVSFYSLYLTETFIP